MDILSILATFKDNTTNKFVSRYFVCIFSSDTNVPYEGTGIPKHFVDNIPSSKIQHNLAKPYSKIHSYKTMSVNDTNNVNHVDVEKLKEYNDLCEYYSSKCFYRTICTKPIPDLMDPITGDYFTFVSFGDQSSYFNSNPNDYNLQTLDERLLFLKKYIDNHTFGFYHTSDYSRDYSDPKEHPIEETDVSDLLS